MKKISLLTKTIFYIYNIGLIVIYLYPGSIAGWLLYGDFQKQPQISTNIIVSSNHVLVFFVITILGILSFDKSKFNLLFLYLFLISIILEFFHKVIPNRSFEYEDLFGNLIGVLLIYALFLISKFIGKKK